MVNKTFVRVVALYVALTLIYLGSEYPVNATLNNESTDVVVEEQVNASPAVAEPAPVVETQPQNTEATPATTESEENKSQSSGENTENKSEAGETNQEANSANPNTGENQDIEGQQKDPEKKEGEEADGEKKDGEKKDGEEESEDKEESDEEEDELKKEEEDEDLLKDNDKWKITIAEKHEHLTIVLSKSEVEKELEPAETITVTVTPDAGYKLKELNIAPTDKNDTTSILYTKESETEYKYSQPEKNVTITASAEKIAYNVAAPRATTNGTVAIKEIKIENHGSKAVDTTKASINDIIVIEAIPDENYSLSSLTYRVNGVDSNALKNSDGKYEIIMPAADITSIDATFKNYVALDNTTKPVIYDSSRSAAEPPQIGDRLNAVTSAVPVQWQWYQDGTAISGATNDVYILSFDDFGKKLSVQAIQVKDSGGENVPADNVAITSDETLPVAKRMGSDISDEEAVFATAIDYINETATMADGYEVTVPPTPVPGNTTLDISDIINKETEAERSIYIRRTESEVAEASIWYTIVLPARPLPPMLRTEKASAEDKADGKIVGTTVDMEYKLLSEKKYTKAIADYISVKPGEYQVRIAATDHSFASPNSDVIVRMQLIELTKATKPVIGNTTASRKDVYVGDVLKVSTKAGPGITYQWYAGGTALKGETKNTLTVPTSAYNKKIAVKATQAANADGEGHPAKAVSVSSDSVGPVKKEPGGSISQGDFKLSIDYTNETATVSSGFELASSGSASSGSSSLKITSIVDKSSDRNVYVRRKSTDSKEASSWLAVSVKTRPDAPKGLGAVKASAKDVADGKITGTTTGMEYKLNGASSYTKATATETKVKAGTYLVRYAASGSNFVSKSVSVKVDVEDTTEEDTEKTTKKKTSSSSKKKTTSKKVDTDSDELELDDNIIDKNNVWDNLSYDTKMALLDILKETGGELVDANLLMEDIDEELDSTPVDDVPVALILGDGVIVIEIDAPDSSVKFNDARAVAKSILSDEQIDLVERGSIFEIKMASSAVNENSLAEEEKIAIETAMSEAVIEHPNLTKSECRDLTLSYKLEGLDWKPVVETNAPLEMVLEVPAENMDSEEDFFVLRVHEGEPTLLNDLDDDPNTVTIMSGQFSTYLILRDALNPVVDEVEEQIVEEVAQDSGRVNLWLILFIVLIVLDVCYVAYLVLKKKNLIPVRLKK